jgi:hypothetical protein
MKVYNALTLPIILYGREIRILRKKRFKKKIYINRDEIFQNSPVNLFDHKRKEKILGELKVEPVERETKKIQIGLATTCDKNEQQQDVKQNAELQTKWTQMTWKTFNETISRG